MKVRYIPRLTIRRDDLERAVQRALPECPDSMRVLDVDEDEATMAVEAVLALLAATRMSIEDVAGVRLLAPHDEDHVGTVGQALLGGSSRASIREDGFEGAEGVVVSVRVDKVRPGSTRLLLGASAFADAWVGEHEPEEVTVHEPVGSFHIDEETALRLGGAEAEATAAIPMGAYVSDATWRRALDVRYRLLVGTCDRAHLHFPPRPHCPFCGGPAGRRPAARTGRVHTYTIISAGGGPSEFDFLQRAWGSYASLVVVPDGMDGVRIPGILEDTPVDRVDVGTRVEAVFRRLYGMQGAWRYGIKWRAIRE